MSILRTISFGFRRATTERKMVLVLYAINLVIAIPLTMAWRSVILAGLGDSLASSRLREGLDFTVFQDFMKIHGEGLSAVLYQISWFMIISMLVNTFLAGGILGAIRDEREKFSASSFFSDCGKYFIQFLRLFLIFVVLLFLAAAVFGALVGIADDALTKNVTSEITDLWVNVSALVVFLIPLTVILMVADYAKIGVVLSNERSMLNSAWRSTRFVFRRFARTLGLEILMVTIPIVFFAMYLSLDLAIGMTSGLTIFVMMVIQQIFMISRAWTKVFFFASEMSLYQSLSPSAVNAAGNEGAEPGVEPAGA